MEEKQICEWKADLIDDTLKILFIAYGEYGSEKKDLKIKAIARLISQKNVKIPLISKIYKNTHKIAIIEDLDKIINKMVNDADFTKIEKEIYRIDKKYALSNIYNFCKCINNK